MSTVVEVNAATGEAVERPMTTAEVKQAEKDLAAAVAAEAAPAPPTLAARLAAVEARLDKAATASVTGEAAKLRDNLKPDL